MWIVAVFTHSVESLVSADVNVTRHVASRAVSVRVSSEGDRNQKKNSLIPTAHCREFDVLLMGLFSVHAPHCAHDFPKQEMVSKTLPIQLVQRDFTLVFIESNCLATATPFVFPY